jgi:hypothetical protein
MTVELMDRADDERDLREWLEHAVPAPPAPPARMRQIRDRMARRRRRRTLALLIGFTAVSAAVAVLLPLAGALPSTPGGRVTSSPASPPAPPPPGGTHVGTEVPQPFPDLFGLSIEVPRGWTAKGGTDALSQVAGFTVTKTTPRPKAKTYCPGADHNGLFCLPQLILMDGGVLIAFGQSADHAKGNGTETFAVTAPHIPGVDCRAIGGTEELTAWGSAAPDGDHPVVDAYVCLSDPSAATRATVDTLLSTAVFTSG